MITQRLQLFRRLALAGDLFLLFLVYLLVVAFRESTAVQQLLNLQEYSPYRPMLLLILPIWGLVLALSPHCYELRAKRLWRMGLDLGVVTLKGAGVLLAALFVLHAPPQSRFLVFLFCTTSWLALVTYRVTLTTALGWARRRGKNLQKLIVVGTGRAAQKLVDQILTHPAWGLRISGFVYNGEDLSLWRFRDIPVIGTLFDLPRIIQNNHIDWVVFAVPEGQLGLIGPSMQLCEEMGTNVCLLTDFFSLRFARKKAGELFGQPVLLFSRAPEPDVRLFIKYCLDRLLAFLGLVLVAPIMACAAVVIKLASPGPVLFRQERCGLNGKRFTLYKFRTMVPEAEALKSQLLDKNEMDGAAFKITNDPRLTPVGKVLRKYSLDELPQLMNVLKGEMSLVGPRPPLPDEVSRFDRWQRRKLSMKPGLTCLWQVNGRNHVNFEKWMRLDLEYIDNWSLWLDAKILAKTVPAVLSGRGAK